MTAGALVGKDGYLFLNNDTNKVLDQFEGRYEFPVEQRVEIKAVHSFREKLLSDTCGGRYFHIIVPNKETVLWDKLPAGYEYQKSGLSPVNSYSSFPHARQAAFFYDPFFLRSLSATELVFAKTDTHWTHAGAINYLKRASHYFMDAEFSQALESISFYKKMGNQAGDLASKLNLPVESLEMWNVQNYSSKIKASNGISNIGALRWFVNDNALLDKKVVVLHDSTALWLMPTISSVYRDVLFLHLPDVDHVWLTKYKPDFLFFIQIERFFIRSPSNDVSLFEVISKHEKLKNSSSPQANLFL